jgi:DHA2 family multidrug resistance protein
MLAVFMAVLDISITNVAINDIRSSFGTPVDQVAWVSTGYMMANVVVIPITGWMQRRFGFRNYLTFSIALFTLASALCGAAWNLPALVFFRVLQGIGGGAIIPTSQAILYGCFPKEEHSKAGSLFALGALTGPLLGPTVGGYIIDLSNWHWVFYVNLPAGCISAWLAWTSIEEPGFAPARQRVDVLGMVLLVIGMASLQYVLEEGHREDWFDSELILTTSLVGYALSTFANAFVGVCVFSGTYLFALYCGTVLRYSALDVGHLVLASGAVQLLFMPIAAKVAARVNSQKLIALGFCVTAVGLWRNTMLTSSMGYWDLALPRMILALGLAMIFVPLSMLALSEMPLSKRGNASALYSLTRELGGSIGTALLSTHLARGTSRWRQVFSERVIAFDSFADEQLETSRRLLSWTPEPESASLALTAARVGREAMVKAFNECFFLILAALLCGAALLLGVTFYKAMRGATASQSAPTLAPQRRA